MSERETDGRLCEREQLQGHLILVGREPKRPLEHRARRALDRAGGPLGGRHRRTERLSVTDHAPAEVAARDDDPAVFVSGRIASAAHRLAAASWSSTSSASWPTIAAAIAAPGALAGSSSTAHPSRSASASPNSATTDYRGGPLTPGVVRTPRGLASRCGGDRRERREVLSRTLSRVLGAPLCSFSGKWRRSRGTCRRHEIRATGTSQRASFPPARPGRTRSADSC
jgi:hypothetical protein